jgi:CheY-like chemotaxis protein
MKLLLIRPVGSTLNIISEKATIEILQFDSEKFKGKLQEFVSSLGTYSFDGLIIPDSLDESVNYLGLELCNRIRLSSNELGDKSYSTFFIYNSKDPQEIYKSQLWQKANTTASLFFTEGVFTFDDNDFGKILIENNSNFNILNKDNFKDSFLNIIQIKKNPGAGNHSIANIWGVIRLAEVTNNELLLQKYFESNPKIAESQSDLYFKLLLSQNSFSKPISVLGTTINASNKNILLIDDEANKGWGSVLGSIFQDAILEVIVKLENESQESFIKRAESAALKTKNNLPPWDLILLDLRLDENEDMGDNANKFVKEYSGAKLLCQIKELNKGTQVIIFTASNKAWNMRELALLGSNGFYVKESPERSIDPEFTLNNYKDFEETVAKCFKLKFLKSIFHKSNLIESILESSEIKNDDFIIRTKRNLLIAFNLFSTSASDERYNNYGYLQLFQIIEDFVQLENVFERADNSSVFCLGEKIAILEIDTKTTKESARNKKYKSKIKREPDGTYKLADDTHTGTIDLYFIVSSLLIFRFGLENSKALPWQELNKKRNDSAHFIKNEIDKEIINKLLDFLIFILNDKNQKVHNSIDSLKRRFENK